ncbi:protein virilizer homolog [Aristolochia californica]|uniref:protein virilizer homolog n=1 Tax=Aristolochia californica TaxID=171875 RepID=UPI0035DA50EE
MVRPEPCVLFAQSFVHPHLDEYVDEIIFAEPVVITACEFLEQNGSFTSSAVTLVGATSPPSFALEVFVHSEEEPRFRRLCQPFLYSHSSSNVLEVEAVITNHLVVRGSYRSLTLVIYGNTAEDLGQVNIEFDLDTSLANLVSSPSEGKLEDLPPALHASKRTFEESISSLKSLAFPVFELDLTQEMKQFLYLILKICQLLDIVESVRKIVDIVVSAVSSYISNDLSGIAIVDNLRGHGDLHARGNESYQALAEARKELLEIYKTLRHSLQDGSDVLFGDGTNLESEAELSTSQLLADIFNQCFLHKRKAPTLEHPSLSESENMILGLSVIFLFCSSREGCFHFVSGGGMGQLAHIFQSECSPVVSLMLLGVVERATRHGIGCEGFLGWWPREDENVPTGTSEGYSYLVKLLLKKQRHDVASLATYLLHRLRCYEIASSYECVVLSMLGNLSTTGCLAHVGLKSLSRASSHVKKLLKLINLRGPVEDPSPVAHARRSLILGQAEGLLSYKATINLISASKCCFSNGDIDPNLLSLLQERGFLPLSAALLSSPALRSQAGPTTDIFVDIIASIEAILFSLLSCRSGLLFLLHQPEIAVAVVLALKSGEDVDKAECVPLRYARILTAKNFLCRTQEVGMITELHLRVVNCIDHLLSAPPHSEEVLWVLWDLCSLSRSDTGRQALLALGHFQEAVLVLIEALRSVKELQPSTLNYAALPLNLAIFHSAAEIFEVMVTDSTASSLASWIGHAVELHKALHSSSPGTNRKDAPTRLLEWIDAGVIYHRNGPIGLLRYAAVLASGGDAHLSSANILVSDSIDVENFVGDTSNSSDVQVIENLLGKLVSDKYFEGVALRDSSIAQLTTAFRILAFISENPAVAVALYEESAVTLVYVVLVNCKYMLERSSSTYDYLVDEGAEGNSMSNLLVECSSEQSLIDLMIPCLMLLVTLLQQLQEVKEQHRNTKLLNALLKLHREVSLKLAACATDFSSPYPGSALGLNAVCRLLVSALACWPVFGWTPGLFHCLLDSVQATSQLALGPKEACSLLWILGDLFPEEGIWLWKSGMPSLCALRTLCVGTVLGPLREKDVDWYLQPAYISVLLSRLNPLLDKVAQVVLHFAFTALVVVHDILRVFIVRIACQKAECALVLLRPIISWIQDHESSSSLSETDIFKGQRLFDFLASLLEHPRAKELLLNEGAIRILMRALQSCCDTSVSDGKLITESKVSNKSSISLFAWLFPILKSLTLIFDHERPSEFSGAYDKSSTSLSIEDYFIVGRNLLKICRVLPVGRELQICLTALKELVSSNLGKVAFASMLPSKSPLEDLEMERGKEKDGNSDFYDDYNWEKFPPLLSCLQNIVQSISKEGFSVYALEAIKELSSCVLCLCKESKNVEVVSVLKYLFGLPHGITDTEDLPEEKLRDVQELLTLLDHRIREDEHLTLSNNKFPFYLVKKSVESMLLLLQKTVSCEENLTFNEVLSSSGEVSVPMKTFPSYLVVPSLSVVDPADDDAGFALSRARKSDGPTEKAGNYYSHGGLCDRFLWECPDSSDRLAIQSLPMKRKTTTVDGPSRRSRGDLGVDNVSLTAFSRGLGGAGATASSGSTRRDTFRQRKPNTSRPPSMHVDDYVARERNADGVSGSNVVSSIQRSGSTGGRPPSIHVDEFMARQRERQNLVAPPLAEAANPQVKNSSTDNENVTVKADASRQLKADLDDDLQEIDIVFDGEPESDDRLPFPQPDDNLGPSPVMVGEDSPHSVVEETETDQNESTLFSHLGGPPSTVDGHLRDELPLRRSISRSGRPLSREPSINSEQNYPSMEIPSFHEQVDETKQSLRPMTNFPQFSSQFYNKGPASSPVQGDPRMIPSSFFQRDIPQQGTSATHFGGASQGLFDDKHASRHPTLPPLPPLPSQTVESLNTPPSAIGQPPLPSAYLPQTFDANAPVTSLPFSSLFTDTTNHPVQLQLSADYISNSSHSPGPSLTNPSVMESKYLWAPATSGSRLHEETPNSNASLRPLQPPLPPTPPPYTAQTSTSQSSPYSQASLGMQLPLSLAPLNDVRLGASYSLPLFTQSSMLGRPASMSNTPLQQQSNQTSVNLSSLPLPSSSSIPTVQPRPPPQPPQPSRPPHPPQQPRPLEPGVSLQQSSIHVQMQPLQIPQQLQIPQTHIYYQTPNLQESISQPLQQQSDSGSQQQLDLGTLQHYFSSPEAIQSLLGDREKLCQLLEQHPKLMQMLQDKLGQL